MPVELVKPRARGFICTNAHPVGCRQNVQNQIDYVKNKARTQATDLSVLVVGASTGYGLASRIALTWGYGAKSLGVFYDRPAEGNRTATAGYYNSVAFHELAQQDSLYAESLNGDAFSDGMKQTVIERVKRSFGQINVLVYSLASPRRTHPRTGAEHQSVLKPIGEPYTSQTIDLRNDTLASVTIEPATEQELADTVAVMGGEDLEFWVDALLAENLLAPECIVVAYSYIGPKMTWPIYRSGTIGRAKDDLEQRIHRIDANLVARLGGHAYTSVNKAIITQASVAIPAVPLYISILNDVMDAKKVNEDAIGQMTRLFTEHLGPGLTPTLDDRRRVRLDNLEFREDTAAEVLERWAKVSTDNFRELGDYDGFKRGFLNLFGFEVAGVDYDAPVEVDVRLPS